MQDVAARVDPGRQLRLAVIPRRQDLLGQGLGIGRRDPYGLGVHAGRGDVAEKGKHAEHREDNDSQQCFTLHRKSFR